MKFNNVQRKMTQQQSKLSNQTQLEALSFSPVLIRKGYHF